MQSTQHYLCDDEECDGSETAAPRVEQIDGDSNSASVVCSLSVRRRRRENKSVIR